MLPSYTQLKETFTQLLSVIWRSTKGKIKTPKLFSLNLTVCDLSSGGQSAAAGGGEPWGSSSARRGGLPRRYAPGEDPECTGWHCPISAPHPQRGTQPAITGWILTRGMHNMILDNFQSFQLFLFSLPSATIGHRWNCQTWCVFTCQMCEHVDAEAVLCGWGHLYVFCLFSAAQLKKDEGWCLYMHTDLLSWNFYFKKQKKTSLWVWGDQSDRCSVIYVHYMLYIYVWFCRYW